MEQLCTTKFSRHRLCFSYPLFILLGLRLALLSANSWWKDSYLTFIMIVYKEYIYIYTYENTSDKISTCLPQWCSKIQCINITFHTSLTRNMYFPQSHLNLPVHEKQALTLINDSRIMLIINIQSNMRRGYILYMLFCIRYII